MLFAHRQYIFVVIAKRAVSNRSIAYAPMVVKKKQVLLFPNFLFCVILTAAYPYFPLKTSTDMSGGDKDDTTAKFADYNGHKYIAIHIQLHGNTLHAGRMESYVINTIRFKIL